MVYKDRDDRTLGSGFLPYRLNNTMVCVSPVVSLASVAALGTSTQRGWMEVYKLHISLRPDRIRLINTTR